MSIFLGVIFTLLWLLLGTLIAEPYTYLASGDTNHYIDTVVVGPACIILLVIAYLLVYKGGPSSWRLKAVFVGFVLYFLSPIILNVISLLLTRFGSESAAEIFFAHRYSVIAYIPVLLLGSGVVYDIVQKAHRKFQVWKRPRAFQITLYNGRTFLAYLMRDECDEYEVVSADGKQTLTLKKTDPRITRVL